jgi:riboflavin biosynthesis pyrimidine reductase
MRTQMETTDPLRTLYDVAAGAELPLPPELARFYGALRFPLPKDRPYVIANLVTSLDGVVSLGVPGKTGGSEISGSNRHDHMLMGLLRAVADAVVVGAGTLREGHGSAPIAANVYPPLAGAYAALRASLNKEDGPLAVIVTASGDLDRSMPIFNSTGRTLMVTTQQGAQRLRETQLPAEVRIEEVDAEGLDAGGGITARAVLDAAARVRACTIVLVEGGPHLLGDFFAGGAIDEQFLTLSPQIVGRDGRNSSDTSGKRLGLVEGQTFAPERPLWGRLSVVKQGESHLFLRYLFDHIPAAQYLPQEPAAGAAPH